MSLLHRMMGNASGTSIEKLTEKYGRLLAGGEQIELGFKLLRDVIMFTEKRMIVIEIQGVTGKKVQYFSLPYKSISRFAVETAGTFDLDAELKIWVSSERQPSFNKRFDKNTDIYEVQKFLCTKIC